MTAPDEFFHKVALAADAAANAFVARAQQRWEANTNEQLAFQSGWREGCASKESEAARLHNQIHDMTIQRDALLQALIQMVDGSPERPCSQVARAAIAKVTGSAS